MGQLPLPPQATASVFSLGNNGGPVVGRVAGGSVQSRRQPCRLWDVSQRPQARRGSCTPTRCLCGTWRSSSSALPVGGCGNPAVGVSPMHPSLTNTLCAAESSSPRQGFEPPSATPQSGGSAGTGVVLLGNGPPWHWQGYFWLRWSSSKEQEQRQEQCWALPQVPHALPQIVPLQLLHILPWQSSWDEKQPLCLCAGVQGTEQCEIYSAVPGSCSWVLKGLGAGGAPWQ